MGTPLPVVGGAGTRLYVEDHGDPNGRGLPTVVLLHGIAHCRRSFRHQLASSLTDRVRLVTVDLRGHGDSDAPADGYGDSETWAEDVHAVVTALAPVRPVLVGWSYGGSVICDYLAVHGDAGVRGLVFVGAVTDLGTERALETLTPDFLATCRDLVRPAAPAERGATVRTFVDLCTAAPLPPDEHAEIHGWSSAVPTHVLAGMLRRRVRHDATLRAVRVPTLVMHGAADAVVRPAQSRHVAELVADARTVTYEGVGHMPFWEAPDRFDADLAAFVDGLPPA